jgi:mannose-1-phosphate guanylyltransferase/mannose-6-phosphate isomerase
VAEQLRRLGVAPAALVVEPCGRNTAPAVAAAARLALAERPDALLLVLPSDHVFADAPAFRAAVEAGRAAAEDGRLVTFGVLPTAAETGYGYIEVDGQGAAEPPWPVRRFVEKPDRERAEAYLGSGCHLWNSGMFLFRADRYLAELARYAPAIAAACEQAVAGARQDLDFLRLDAEAFAACPADSVDYAVMEHTERAVAVPLAAGWNDVGSWSALRGIRSQDGDGNAVHGDVWLEDSHGCYVHAEERMVAAIGLRDHIVVETADAVLVAPCDRAQEVKTVVERLKAAGRTETFSHRRVYRPWGSYEGISRAERFQVKRIVVEPGARLSLQMHHHRAEHWVVVRGTARVTCGDQELLLSEDQSSYIPVGVVHRLENPGVIPLELIEVQTGSYLGEDDIVRFDDRYGRERVG